MGSLEEATAKDNDLIEFEKREAVPEGYIDIGPAPLDLTIDVSNGLAIPDVDLFNARFEVISDPSNPAYGQFLTQEELSKLVTPPQTVIDLVLQWIKLAFGVEATYSQGTFTLKASVKTLNTVLQTEYHTFKSTPNNYIAVVGFRQEYANKADLQTFLKTYRPELVGTPFQEVFIDGGQNLQDPAKAGIEANLDIQYIVGIAAGVPVTFVSSGLSNMNGLQNLVDYFLSSDNPPSVLSISYGFNENQVSSNQVAAVCNAFQQLGSRGVSVIVATGDGGVAGSRPNNTCIKIIPTFPASCPYVTAVGATKNMMEVGAELSAGGFSNIFARPFYQNPALPQYLSKIGGTYAGRFNSNGRAYPDVSAIGKNLAVTNGGEQILVDGTSASAPIFASIVAMINDRRFSSGKPALGFLNPFLYSHPNIFNDIISGNNPSCGTPGFSAQNGWDPVTGLGTAGYKRFAMASGVSQV
ncbi:hypothetical protein BGZ73_004275 [Actinomortierella ambigua]|nr:hypothetical protein BGZ73_004275 [Actinomortierella ambigua]